MERLDPPHEAAGTVHVLHLVATLLYAAATNQNDRFS